MKIGLMHVTPNSTADPAIVAKRAEEMGFESYWVGDHTIIPVKSSEIGRASCRERVSSKV